MQCLGVCVRIKVMLSADELGFDSLMQVSQVFLSDEWEGKVRDLLGIHMGMDMWWGWKV